MPKPGAYMAQVITHRPDAIDALHQLFATGFRKYSITAFLILGLDRLQ